jgi:hypothetical protein
MGFLASAIRFSRSFSVLAPSAVAAFAIMAAASIIPAPAGLRRTFLVPAPPGLRRTFVIPVPPGLRHTFLVPGPLRLDVVADVDSTRPMGYGVSGGTSSARWWRRAMIPRCRGWVSILVPASIHQIISLILPCQRGIRTYGD